MSRKKRLPYPESDIIEKGGKGPANPPPPPKAQACPPPPPASPSRPMAESTVCQWCKQPIVLVYNYWWHVGAARACADHRHFAEPVAPVEVEDPPPCRACGGTGRGPHDKYTRTDDPLCPACDGSGREPVGVVEQPEAPTHHHVGLEECPACVAAQAAENAEHAEPVVQPVDGPPSCPGCKMPLEQSQEGRWHHRSGGTIQRRCPLWDAPDIQPALPVDPRPTREAPTREAIRAALRDWWLNDDASGGPDSDVDGMMRVLDELGALRVASESHPTRLVAARLPYDEDQFPQRLKFSLVKDGGFWITIRRHPGGPPEWVAADELIEVPS